MDGGINTTTLKEYKDKLSKEALTAVISDRDMMPILCNHVMHWKQLARLGFGLSEFDVYQIDHDYNKDGVKECLWQAYQKYIRKRPSAIEMYITEILEIFYKAKQHKAIEVLIENIEAKVSQ